MIFKSALRARQPLSQDIRYVALSTVFILVVVPVAAYLLLEVVTELTTWPHKIIDCPIVPEGGLCLGIDLASGTLGMLAFWPAGFYIALPVGIISFGSLCVLGFNGYLPAMACGVLAYVVSDIIDR